MNVWDDSDAPYPRWRAVAWCLGVKAKEAMLGRCCMILSLGVILGFGGCSDKQRSAERPGIGVTTTWLASAVRDIAGRDVDVVCLLPPGDCPGHFDVSPGMVKRLSRCEVLFRFDFQRGVDETLSGLTSRGLRVVEISGTDGLCVPVVYLEACRQIAEVVRTTSEVPAEKLADRLSAVESRLSSLMSRIAKMTEDARVRGEKVICSEHQEQFCKWLGLDVVATFPRAENMSSSFVQQLIAAAEESNVRIVIANLQEGRKAADSIAQRLGASVVVFSNFPAMDSDQAQFEALVLDNVQSLIKGVSR